MEGPKAKWTGENSKMAQVIDMIKQVAVIGVGQMGRGIAQVAAQSGLEVVLFDISQKRLDEGYDFIDRQLAKGAEKEKWPSAHREESLGRITKTMAWSDLRGCDLAIEAVSEKKQVKFDIFRQLDKTLPSRAILTSNTSSISLTEIGAVTQRPAQVAGMHFMNPVPVMELVEAIRGLETSDEVFIVVKKVAEKMGKVVIEAKDLPGFAVNRILMPMINEACFALHEGLASAADIDQAMKLGCRWPMGPLELADFIGLDTCLAIMNVLFEGLGEDKYRPCPLLKRYVAAGRLGRKSKKGLYDYGG